MKSTTSIFSNFKECGPQLLAVFLGTINAISDGMQFGWTSPMIPRYQEPDAPFYLSEFDITWLEVVYMLTGLIGLPITIFLVDKFGRKASTLIASSVCIVGWILIGISDNVLYLYAARIIMGISGDIAFIASPMYIAEVASQNIRGFLSGIIYVMVFVGILVIYSIGPFAPLYMPSIIGVIILVFQLCTFSFMPESPYFLMYKNRHAEAKIALTKLRGTDSESVEAELKIIEATIQRQRSEKGSILDLWRIRSNRKAVLIMTLLNLAQHMAGLTVITMNVHLILAAAESIYLPAETSAILFASFMLISTCITINVIDKFGRKILILVSTFASGLVLLTLAIFFHLKHNNVEVSGISWIPIMCVMLFAAFFKSGLGLVPIVLTAELFPARVKAMGMGYADGVYILSSAFSIFMYRFLIENVNLFTPFYIFSTSCFITGVLTILYIPETKGKTLEQIQMILKK